MLGNGTESDGKLGGDFTRGHLVIPDHLEDATPPGFCDHLDPVHDVTLA